MHIAPAFCTLLHFSLNVSGFFLRKIASHPLLHTASAFEVCCHVALRHVLYSAAEIVCSLQMSHSKGECVVSIVKYTPYTRSTT